MTTRRIEPRFTATHGRGEPVIIRDPDHHLYHPWFHEKPILGPGAPYMWRYWAALDDEDGRPLDEPEIFRGPELIDEWTA